MSTMEYTIHTHGQSSALCLVIFRYFLTAQQRGTVRLVRNGLTSTSYSSGRVQVYMNSWGYICDDLDFDIIGANVICHQLGYSGALSHSKSSLDSWVLNYTVVCTLCKLVMCWVSIMRYSVSYRYGVDSSYNFVMADVDCSNSDYLVILQCHYSSYTGSCVRNRDEVSVICRES